MAGLISIGVLVALTVVAAWFGPRSVAAMVRRRLGGYEQQVNVVDEDRPTHLQTPKSALVVGGGLAGISAASHLARRGFSVTLREKAPYLGGKIGAWHIDVDGQRLEVEHGFHAFFRHYYNLRRFLDETGVSDNLTPIDDYLIVGEDGQERRFGGLETTPILNLIALWRRGMFRIRDIVLGPAIHEMDAFLSYDPQATFEALDNTSYRRFADRAALPAELRLVFNTFARAFFAEDDRMSMAELVKSFHFFYLSHDHGLLYDYPTEDYQTSVIAPIRAHLEQQGVSIELGRGVEHVAPRGDRGVVVDGERFDHVVLATSSVAARKIAARSPELAQQAPALAKQLLALSPSQRYAVLRLWLDRPMRDDVPVFVATERKRVLDSVTAYHRITTQARNWAAENGGSVVELHCYAVPDTMAEDTVSAALFEDMISYFPELEGARIVHESLQLNANFTAFHVGMAANRPETKTELRGLHLAGDWVRLPIPAMLMEAAFSSGLLAANAVFAVEGLREDPVLSVPTRGVLKPRDRREDRRPRVGRLRPRRSA